MTAITSLIRPKSVLLLAQRDLASQLQPLGFEVSGPVSDRHGALQLTFVATAGPITTYIIFGEALGVKGDGYRGSIDVVFESGREQLLKRRVYATTVWADFERELQLQALHAVRAASPLSAEVVGSEGFLAIAPGKWRTVEPLDGSGWRLGNVSWVDKSKGFGFITYEGEDVLFKVSPARFRSVVGCSDLEFALPIDQTGKIVLRPPRSHQH